MASSTNGPNWWHNGDNNSGGEERPVYDGSSGDRVGHTHESFGQQLENGAHEWHEENADGSETVHSYTTNDDNW